MTNEEIETIKSKQAHIKYGGIYLVLEDIDIAYRDMSKKYGNLPMIRKMIIPCGELLEFRFWSDAHFRDRFNLYFEVHNNQLHKLKKVAQIFEKVKCQNIAELGDIIRLHLYDLEDGELPLKIPSLETHFENVSLNF